MKQKLIAMMGSLLTTCMALSIWLGTDFPCVLLFGEYEYPVKENY